MELGGNYLDARCFYGPAVSGLTVVPASTSLRMPAVQEQPDCNGQVTASSIEQLPVLKQTPLQA